MSNEKKSESPRLYRRSFFEGASKVAAGSALASGLVGALEGRAVAESNHRGPQSQGRPADLDEQLRWKQREVRIERAEENYEVPVGGPLGEFPTNGDEERYTNKIGTDTRGLPHDEYGEVLPAAWQALRHALDTRREEDFEKIPLGGSGKFNNPLGPLGLNLSGLAASQQIIAPAPALASAERAADAVEVYWLALLRDVPFAELRNDTKNELVLAAAQELTKLSGYTRPRDTNGVVTPELLFRGTARYYNPGERPNQRIRHVVPPGVTVGPYLSQFLLKDAPYGVHTLSATIRAPLPGTDFLTDYDEWLTVQNGGSSGRTLAYDPVRRYITTIRDLAVFDRNGTSAEWLVFPLLSSPLSDDPLVVSGVGARSTPTDPYLKYKTHASGSASWGAQHVGALLPLVLLRALRSDYYNKWYVHRTLRPEAFGGLVHHVLANGADYPIHDDVLNSEAVDRTFQKFGTYLISATSPGGAPRHSAYPGGSSSQASAIITVLKAFYDESYVIPDPVQPDPNDPTKLIPYDGPPLTVGGELNKFAANIAIGRDAIGVHYRSDAAVGLAEAEHIAISLLQDEVHTFHEKFDGFRFHRFDGTEVWIRP